MIPHFTHIYKQNLKKPYMYYVVQLLSFGQFHISYLFAPTEHLHMVVVLWCVPA